MSARIQLCGHFVVEVDGRHVESELPARKGRMLLAYLALNRDRPVRRDELIEALWPDPPGDPDAALKTLLSRTRRALGPGVVEGRSELSLRGATIDLERAVAALAEARATGDWQVVWAQAQVALGICRRGLLPGLEAPWIDARRREVEELELEALELVAEAGLGVGGAELAAAERAGRALVERAPFRESGYAVQMRVLACRGNVAEALRLYEELRTFLRDELGTAPSAQLADLHRRLLDRSAGDVPSASLPPQLVAAALALVKLAADLGSRFDEASLRALVEDAAAISAA